MSWSWKIGRLAGIDVRVHVTFLLLVAWMSITPLVLGKGLAAVAAALGLNLAVFSFVLLHELGHALAARRYGIKTRDITLWPLGGIASLERMPVNPRQELVVALAGPAVNVGLALVFAALTLLGGSFVPAASGLPGTSLMAQLLLINVTMAAFNLIPAFPLDGGRVLRAVMAMRFDRVRATWIAARVGQGFAVLFGIAGLFLNPMLTLIAVFVWVAAQQEATATEAMGRAPRFPMGQDVGLYVIAVDTTEARWLIVRSNTGAVAQKLGMVGWSP
ncbi:MAG: site-2 protease family protein [Deltaproteobacteria bacterium]|nr:site-2 protease family protein [Deltaproteobacteria bacterium]